MRSFTTCTPTLRHTFVSEYGCTWSLDAGSCPGRGSLNVVEQTVRLKIVGGGLLAIQLILGGKADGGKQAFARELSTAEAPADTCLNEDLLSIEPWPEKHGF